MNGLMERFKDSFIKTVTCFLSEFFSGFGLILLVNDLITYSLMRSLSFLNESALVELIVSKIAYSTVLFE